MTIYYSASTKGFYDLLAADYLLPEDAVEITRDAHAALIVAQQEGRVIVADALGAPIAVDPASLVTLDQVKALHVATLRAACEASITGGFKSAALGAVHTYPSDMKAQINLMGSVTDSLMPNLASDWQTPFWVCDAAGVWTYKMHSAAQIQQAGRDGKALVISCQTLIDNLTNDVLAATTPAAVAAIVWPEGVEA